MTLTCPVCETCNEEPRCRQCSTDLAPLARVNELPESYSREGDRLLAAGNIEAALEHFAAAAALEPSADAHLRLARAYARQSLVDQALAHCDAALQLAPDRSDVADARREIEASRPKPVEQKAAEPQVSTPSRRPLWIASAAALIVGFASFSPVTALAHRVFGGGEPAPATRVREALARYSATNNLALSAAERGGSVVVTGKVPDAVRLSLVRDIAQQNAGEPVDLSGIVVESSTSTAPVTQSARTYRVRAGDSLWSIARREYGNAEIWRELEKANRQAGKPLRMRVGDLLQLPAIQYLPKSETEKGK